MTDQEIADSLTPAQRRVISAMEPGEYYQASDLKTSGNLLWELNDFERDKRGIAPPIQMVFPDVMEPEMLRIWQILPLGLRIRTLLEKANG
jgi:hypothetical protein